MIPNSRNSKFHPYFILSTHLVFIILTFFSGKCYSDDIRKNAVYVNTLGEIGYERAIFKHLRLGGEFHGRLYFHSKDESDVSLLYYGNSCYTLPLICIPFKIHSFEFNLQPKSYFVYQNAEISLRGLSCNANLLYLYAISPIFQIGAGLRTFEFNYDYKWKAIDLRLLSGTIIQATYLF